ncbi:MAG: ABC transporter permease subunit/CPBP intramembrane protease [Planctomycetota bacterium]
MTFPSRIWVIYVKELVDILRDRRTLIAMILVPVLLYPLLMLGVVQAVSVQESSLRQDPIVIATPDAAQRAFLDGLIQADHEWLKLESNATSNGVVKEENRPQALEARVLDASGDPAKRTLEQLVRAREIHVGVRIAGYQNFHPLTGHLNFELACDPEETRSHLAATRLTEVFQRTEERLKRARLENLGVPEELLKPISLQRVDLPTPGSVLSQILPLILVLMTITGAIYPAIDLTAGERERGTLETLMVCPVPVIQLVAGKFLVITTIAIMGAVLNLASISATVYFGGFQAALSGAQGTSFPFAVFPIILVALIPFAILFSAVMIAVCSYAHTFKEAQNYITPIILAALVPGGIAALPATKLAGPMLVMPVANMVLLTRELLLGASEGRILGGNVTWTALVWVLASTALYAAAAVAVAAKIFGTESVIFADTGSLRSAFSRRLIRPAPHPSVSMAALVVALLFPTWFYFQHGLQGAAQGDYVTLLRATSLWMPLLFVGAPLLVLRYWKVNVARTWRLRGTGWRFYVAAVLIGLTVWVPLRELFLLQTKVLPLPPQVLEAETSFNAALASLSPWLALLMIAVIPGTCEELFFRGFLMSGLRSAAPKWTAIFVTACVFGIFHWYFFKIPLTVLLGIVLSYLCWQAGSIGPAVVAHVLHNGFVVVRTRLPDLNGLLGMNADDPLVHLPITVILPALALTVLGLALCRQANTDLDPASDTRAAMHRS